METHEPRMVHIVGVEPGLADSVGKIVFIIRTLVTPNNPLKPGTFFVEGDPIHGTRLRQQVRTAHDVIAVLEKHPYLKECWTIGIKPIGQPT